MFFFRGYLFDEIIKYIGLIIKLLSILKIKLNNVLFFINLRIFEFLVTNAF